MINFERLENQIDQLARRYKEAEPFPIVTIDNFAHEEKLIKAVSSFPTPEKNKIKQCRDYLFVKNKYVKSDFKYLSAECEELYKDFTSERFKNIIRQISGKEDFIDKEFHGGGIHQGGEGSFLDMHIDFNYQPFKQNWHRHLNRILYLNRDWKKEYKGQLKLKNAHTGKTGEIEPIFNRCVIMLTSNYTIHGYDRINFPKGQFRCSIATYAYYLDEHFSRAEYSLAA